MQTSIKSTDRIKVANQLDLRQESLLDYPGGPNVIRVLTTWQREAVKLALE